MIPLFTVPYHVPLYVTTYTRSRDGFISPDTNKLLIFTISWPGTDVSLPGVRCSCIVDDVATFAKRRKDHFDGRPFHYRVNLREHDFTAALASVIICDEVWLFILRSRVTHICNRKPSQHWLILWPLRRQTFIWTNAILLSIGPSGIILLKISTHSLMDMHLNVFLRWRSFCLGLNVLLHYDVIKWEHFPCHWPFVGKFTGDHWNPLTKAGDAELWCFLSAPEQTVE